MSEIAIRADGLTTQYHVGLDGAGYLDLATSLTDGSGYTVLNGQRGGFMRRSSRRSSRWCICSV
jgi:hypothetical protein